MTNHRKLLRFIVIAIGSAGESDSLLGHAMVIGALDQAIGAELVGDLTIIRKMLFKLRAAVQRPAAVREANQKAPIAAD